MNHYRHGGPAPEYGNVKKITVTTFKPMLSKRRIVDVDITLFDGSELHIISGWNPYSTKGELLELLGEWYGDGIEVEKKGGRLKQ